MKTICLSFLILSLTVSCSRTFTVYESNLDKIKNVNGRIIRVSGIVSDKRDRLPLPGANIRVKGTNILIQSDLDGKYLIYVKKSDVLICQFTGFYDVEKKIRECYAASPDSMTIDVRMQGGEELNK